MIASWAAYFRERLPGRLFVPVVLLLTFAAVWVANAQDPGAWVRAATLMSLLVVQFRLWDDLSDRERDRRTHPHRVLGRAEARPFKQLACALAIAGLATAWRLGGGVPLLALTGLNLAFAALYGLIRPQLKETVWRFPVLLAKYPAFVLIVSCSLGRPAGGRLFVAALLAYGAAHAYEAIHSSSASSKPFAPDESESQRPT